MTIKEKIIVNELRIRGMGYKKIAKQTGIPLSTIKMHCKRNNVRPGSKLCDMCGGVVPPGQRRFCCKNCRDAWWMANKDLVYANRYTYECKHCHRVFTSSRNEGQKYCCHNCYIKARYGEQAGS